jgi:hypothetical protein
MPDITKYVTVYTADGIELSLFAEVARALGHKDRKRLDESEFWEALGANARHGIRLCDAAIREGGPDA